MELLFITIAGQAESATFRNIITRLTKLPLTTSAATAILLHVIF